METLDTSAGVNLFLQALIGPVDAKGIRFIMDVVASKGREFFSVFFSVDDIFGVKQLPQARDLVLEFLSDVYPAIQRAL